MDNTTWNKSFHGGQEIVADKFQLCARHVEAQRGAIVGTPHIEATHRLSLCSRALLRLRQRCRLMLRGPAGNYQWVNFTSCLNGYKGIAICTYYLPNQIQANSKICAEATGFDYNALHDCATGPLGEQLYKESVFYTSDMIAEKVIPPYGTGKDQGIPIIR